MEVFIYALRDPQTEAIRYVGKTINTKKRLTAHINEKGERRKNRWLRSLNCEPTLYILEKTSHQDWKNRERWWIKYCREMGCDLTNHTDGVDGLHGASLETRAKLSVLMTQRMSDHSFRVRIFTPERARRISLALKGKKKAAEHVAKLPQNRIGRTLTEEHRAKLSRNASGHRWSGSDALLLSQMNRGNKHGIGNRSRSGMRNSLEMNAKIALFQKGKPKTLQQRQRMSEARKSWWERNKNVA